MMPSFAVKRRPPKSALARNTDGGDQFDPTPAWTMGGGLGGAKDRSFCYGAQIFGALRFS
jgi:hypothetical protein